MRSHFVRGLITQFGSLRSIHVGGETDRTEVIAEQILDGNVL